MRDIEFAYLVFLTAIAFDVTPSYLVHRIYGIVSLPWSVRFKCV